jgi:hypothetical protein
VNFTGRRFDRRIDEIVDLATRNPVEARAWARRFLEWLIRTGSQDPETESAIESVRALLEVLDG